MEAYYISNRLLCQFDVMGSRLLSSYERTDANTITFEIVFGKAQAVSTTGNQTVHNAAIPTVMAYPVNGFQRAILKKQ